MHANSGEDRGTNHQLKPMSTVLEVTNVEVLPVIMCCHDRVMEMSDRAVTDVRTDDRKDRQPSMERKMESVRRE
jgi:uncharacterized protein YqgV (UPF0045/DUF77 family)